MGDPEVTDAAFQRLWTKYAALPNYDKAQWTAAFNEIWETAAGRPESDVLKLSGERFPVQSKEGQPKSVPWAMVAGHEAQAQKNHYDTLKRLAERAGLDPQELWCVVHDQPFAHAPRREWCDAWLSGINDLRIALVRAVYAAQGESQ